MEGFHIYFTGTSNFMEQVQPNTKTLTFDTGKKENHRLSHL